MAVIPTPHRVQVRRFNAEAGTDAHGNPTTGFGDPFDWWVHGVAPGASEEPRKPNRDLSVVAWTIYAPNGQSVPGERDQVALPWEPNGRWYDVEGRPDDWTHGPFANPVAGVVVELRRPEG